MRLAAFLLLGLCAASSSPAAPRPKEVTAVVEKIIRNGQQDRIQGGGMISWTVVEFVILDPRAQFGKTVHVTCAGHPFLGDKPLLIGQRVRFVMPKEPDSHPLTDLQRLRRVSS
ncbi:MAG TPA: hypothetical protein VJ276_18510 [Thermoanaerobaculia bacterium]|nr:hypothetical protein [Thermoanaerobaculia bacterium]